MIGPVFQFEDLQRLCRPNPEAPKPTLATVERWAKRIHLRYTYDGQGGILTTEAALNEALGLKTGAANDDGHYPADIV